METPTHEQLLMRPLSTIFPCSNEDDISAAHGGQTVSNYGAVLPSINRLSASNTTCSGSVAPTRAVKNQNRPPTDAMAIRWR
jgi:hypothetical protein